MMSTQSDLNFLFHRARDYGHPEAQALVKAWDHLTDLDPESAIEMAEGEDLKEQVSDLEKEVDKLEDRSAALQATIEQLRWNLFHGCKKFSCDFSDDHEFYQEAAAREAVKEYAPDTADDVQCAYLLIEDGEVTEVWTSPSFSSHVAFSRVY